MRFFNVKRAPELGRSFFAQLIDNQLVFFLVKEKSILYGDFERGLVVLDSQEVVPLSLDDFIHNAPLRSDGIDLHDSVLHIYLVKQLRYCRYLIFLVFQTDVSHKQLVLTNKRVQEVVTACAV